MKTLNQKLDEARNRLEEAQENLRSLRKAARNREASPSTIGGVIRELREAREISLRELSRKAGVGFGMLYGLETQPQHNPTYNNLLRIAAGLDMKLSELVAQVEARKGNLSATIPPAAKSAPAVPLLTPTGRVRKSQPA